MQLLAGQVVLRRGGQGGQRDVVIGDVQRFGLFGRGRREEVLLSGDWDTLERWRGDIFWRMRRMMAELYCELNLLSSFCIFDYYRIIPPPSTSNTPCAQPHSPTASGETSSLLCLIGPTAMDGGETIKRTAI